MSRTYGDKALKIYLIHPHKSIYTAIVYNETTSIRWHAPLCETQHNQKLNTPSDWVQSLDSPMSEALTVLATIASLPESYFGSPIIEMLS